MTYNIQRQRGSALIYILIAVALMAALTVAFMEPSSQQGQSQNTYKTINELQSQVSLISTAIQDCVLTYPGGDNTINGSGTTDAAQNAPYPIKPNSTHFSVPAADNRVKYLRCPGNPGNDADHAVIFSAAAGKFLPPPPALFGDWKYYNGKDGVFFWIETSKSDSYLATAITKLDEEYAACESDAVDATGGVVQMETAVSTVTCPNGSRCFRYWVIKIGSGAPACP